MTDCCNLFTDGSFKDGQCGYGVYIDDPDRIQRRYLGSVFGKRSNNTAELTAIIKGIEFCKMITDRPIHLFTDSAYCIMSISM